MAFSQIKITFNQDLALDEVVSFKKQFNDGSFTSAVQTVTETWKNFRSGAGEVAIGMPTAIVGERSAINYMAAVEADYLWQPFSNVQMFSRNGNEVIIRQGIYWSFDISGITVPANVDIEITNFSGGLFVMNSFNFETATTNPVCTHFNINFQFNKNIVKYQIGNNAEVIISATNEIDLEFLRGQTLNVTFTDEDDNELTFQRLAYQVPGVINSSITTLNISAGPQTAVAVVEVAFTGINVLEYSLDNSTWQSSNTFAGLMPDNYTIYVRDDFGCSFSVDFITNTSGVVTPYTYYSDSNSIHMAIRETFGNCGPYPNDTNTLSHETYAIDPNLAYCIGQLFQRCDVITVQFRSNFSNNTANVLKEDGTSEALTVFQKTSNIGRKDARDGIRYSAATNKTGIYFTSGNTYDYDTEALTGSYTLNGGLPEYAIIGNWININAQWYQIENIVFDDSLLAEVIIIDGAFVGSPENVIVKSLFNRQNYEVYETTIDMSNYTDDSIIEVEILNEDSNYNTVRRLSEKIWIKDRHEETIEVQYYNPNNTDILYSTGIKHKIRVRLVAQRGDHEDDSETNKGDYSSALTSSSVFKLTEFELGPMDVNLYYKTLEALSHKIISIDGVGYIKNGNIEKEGPLEESNLYLLTAKMLKTNRQFNANVSEFDSEIVLNEENIEVPNVVITDSGEFISY